jgi:hypothetical protein
LQPAYGKLELMRRLLITLILLLCLLSACNFGKSPPALPPGDPAYPLPLPEFTQPGSTPPSEFTVPAGLFPRQQLPIVQRALETPTPPGPPPASAGLSLAVDPRLPANAASLLALPEWLAYTANEAEAGVVLTAGDAPRLGWWVYALATPFPTLASEVSAEDLHRAWRGQGGGPFGSRPLLMDEAAYQLWESVWGPAEAGAVEILPAEELLDEAWQRGTAWALLPFESLEPRWKVLAVDGQSPLAPDFDPEAYPLSLPLTVRGEGVLPEIIGRELGQGSAQPLLPGTNLRSGRLTRVAMTGVTALVRATAFTMEQRGITYPAQDIGGLLRAADILHISNEVPFARDCPYPNPVQEGLKFCSSPEYMALLEEIGTDVVELTGDHFADWGLAAMEYTLDLYEQAGWPVYGGGRNLDAGQAPLLLEHNGNKIAFIGCNAKGGAYAQAGPGTPGAVRCDFDYMTRQIARLAEDGYNVIATFQHFEYYTYQAQPNQIADSQALAEAGAVIVSGSQAHQPQGMEFYRQSFIHYGLGNLFFDQYEISLPTRQGFIDRHVFYEGRHISTELIPILFVDFARPRLMDEAEARDLLTSVFSASGW